MLKTTIGMWLSIHSDSAVESITFRPRSSASRCVSSGRNSARRFRVRVGRVDALDAVLGHQDDLGVDLVRAQRGGGVGREERVAGAGGEDDDAVLLEVADRAAADVGLGDLGDGDRRLHARVHALVLERVLQRQRVEHGREHAHVVGGRALHARRGALQAAVDVARADHDRDLDAAIVDLADLARDRLHALRVGAVGEVAHERLPRQLEQDSLEGGLRHAPTWNFAKRRITTFSPVVPRELRADLLDRLAVVLVAVDVRLVEQDDLLHPLAQLALGDLGRARSRACRPPAARTRAARRPCRPAGSPPRRRSARRGEPGDVQRDVAREGDEVLVARDEVGVAVDLDEHAGLAVRVDVGLDGALGGLAAAHLERLVAEADAQQLDGGVDVAAGLGQRRLAIHHSRARLVAQLLDLRRGDRGVVLMPSRSPGSSALPSCPPSWRAACAPASSASPSPRRAGGVASACARRGGRGRLVAAWAAAAASASAVPSAFAGAASTAAATSASAAALSPPPLAVVASAGAASAAERPQPPERARRERPQPRARRSAGAAAAAARPQRRAPERPPQAQRRRLGGRGSVTLGLARGGLLGLLALALLLLAGGALLGLLAGLLLGLLAGALLLGPERLVALRDDVADRLRDDRAGLDRVVVARDHVVDAVRVAVRVDEADDRDPQALGLLDRDDLGLEVDDEHRVGRALHVLDAAEVGLELRQVGLGGHALTRREQRRAGPPSRSARDRAGA